MPVSAQKYEVVCFKDLFNVHIFTERILQWASGYDESVEVNQRALIDKILARYSGEFTVFRELLQNADDAQATTVEISFETQRFLDIKKGASTLSSEERSSAPLPDLRTTPVSWHVIYISPKT
jgi:hypothetical protein